MILKVLTMVIYRGAKFSDVENIHKILNDYASEGLMLSRSRNAIYENLRDYIIAVDGAGRFLGCGALHFVWDKIAEIRRQEEEIAKHAAAIDIKKRAVRRVKRRQRIQESDSTISNIAEAVIIPSTDNESNVPGSETVGQTDSFAPVEKKESSNKVSETKAKHQLIPPAKVVCPHSVHARNREGCKCGE